MNYKAFFAGLGVAIIGGAVNGAAVAAATGFSFDPVHLKAIAGAAVVGGLFNASMYLKQPNNTGSGQYVALPVKDETK